MLLLLASLAFAAEHASDIIEVADVNTVTGTLEIRVERCSHSTLTIAQWNAIRRLEGRIGEQQMIAMNAAVELEGKSFAAVAGSWLAPAATGDKAGKDEGAGLMASECIHRRSP